MQCWPLHQNQTLSLWPSLLRWMCHHVQCHDGSRQQYVQTGWCRLSQQLGWVSSGWALTTGADTSEPSGSCSSTVCYHHLWPPRGVSSICELAVFQVETEQLGHWQQPKNQQKSNEWGSSRGMLAGTVRMESNSTHQVERPHPFAGLHGGHWGWTAPAAQGHHLVSAWPNRQWTRPRVSVHYENKQQLCTCTPHTDTLLRKWFPIPPQNYYTLSFR